MLSLCSQRSAPLCSPACSSRRQSACRAGVRASRPQQHALTTPAAPLAFVSTVLPARRSVPTTVARAAAHSDPVVAAAGDAPKEQSGLAKTLGLGFLFALWYAFNIQFNIYNKQVLKAFPHPITITAFQFLVGSVLACCMWLFRLHNKPEGSFKDNAVSISPLAAVHTLGNMLTNISLGSVAVSFTHTIKALEPMFSVLLSAMFLNDKPSLPVLLVLLPIIGGVVLASTSELSFTWKGFLSAMGSNVTFQSRNVLSKKFMTKGKGSQDNINLFSLITIVSFFILAPVALLTDGLVFTPAAMAAAGILDTQLVMKRALLSAICFHAYQQVSYMILQRVSPVTHSIGNSVKRVVVIASSILVFRNPVTSQNLIGTAIALAGVFAYSQVKRVAPKEAPKAA
ncbi:hypothetical protein D9Q98_006582 [Chlorella vulgaris]|uniref:Sugar phosphate transporter domain-containing protein n=1 Tax=Chlorella vulgaris TaxID=3077 RepID=A0A9D4YV52_CHLVU|nr:hypothetical protein D9Q98_006582 [Chlorella vulgaris]